MFKSAVSAVKPRDAEQKEARSYVVDEGVLERLAQLDGRSAESHQKVTGQQHQFEEDEQVENVPRQERTVYANEQKMEPGVVVQFLSILAHAVRRKEDHGKRRD